MIKSGIQYHINRQLQCNAKLYQPIVASTTGCALAHFTTLKSGILVEFSTLLWESDNVVTLYQANTMLHRHAAAPHCAAMPGLYMSGKLQAASCEL